MTSRSSNLGLFGVMLYLWWGSSCSRLDHWNLSPMFKTQGPSILLMSVFLYYSSFLNMANFNSPQSTKIWVVLSFLLLFFLFFGIVLNFCCLVRRNQKCRYEWTNRDYKCYWNIYHCRLGLLAWCHIFCNQHSEPFEQQQWCRRLCHCSGVLSSI